MVLYLTTKHVCNVRQPLSHSNRFKSFQQWSKEPAKVEGERANTAKERTNGMAKVTDEWNELSHLKFTIIHISHAFCMSLDGSKSARAKWATTKLNKGQVIKYSLFYSFLISKHLQVLVFLSGALSRKIWLVFELRLKFAYQIQSFFTHFTFCLPLSSLSC